MTTVTQTLNPDSAETSTNQEPDLCDETNQGEDPDRVPPPHKEEESPDRIEDAAGQAV